MKLMKLLVLMGPYRKLFLGVIAAVLDGDRKLQYAFHDNSLLAAFLKKTADDAFTCPM